MLDKGNRRDTAHQATARPLVRAIGCARKPCARNRFCARLPPRSVRLRDDRERGLTGSC